MNYVYLLRCSDGSLYCGWTTDPEARAAAHNSGRGAKYTRSRLPAELVYTEAYTDRREAQSREWHIKRMSRAEKEKLIESGKHMKEKQGEQRPVLSVLAEDYPLLYLNPDEDDRETYRSVVLRGEDPVKRSLAHYRGDPADSLETVDTPAGPVRVVTLGNRRDFELVIRGLMAAKAGPREPVPESQGAAMLYVFNWRRIHDHLDAFPESERGAEFTRFTSVKANYLDMLVVLSRGPYSHVDAAAAGFGEKEWLEDSDAIRRYHELTHVICRRLYPDNIDPVRDELIADTVGLEAAFGHFDTRLEDLFLGIRDGAYTGGRLANYTDTPEEKAPAVCAAMEKISGLLDGRKWEDPFELIPVLMDAFPPRKEV